jgi:hypothetical protein
VLFIVLILSEVTFSSLRFLDSVKNLFLDITT